MTRWWVRASAVAGLLAISCGSAHGLAISPSTASASRSAPVVTAFPVPTIYPAPATASSARLQNPCPAVRLATQFPASAPSSRSLALVTLRGSQGVLVRDITDINHPSTVGAFAASSTPRFVTATEVSYVDSDGNLVRFSYLTSSRAVVATCAGAFDWSPDGGAVVYTTQSESGMDVHQLSAGVDRVLGSVPSGGIGGCESIAGCQIANYLDFRLSYSPDGTTISLVFSLFAVNVFRVWSSDGRLLRSSDSQRATMSAWSGTGLYFRDSAGVEVFRDRADSTFLSGVAWIKPNASPSGGQIVYTARDGSGWGHVYIVDTTTSQVRELKTARTDAVFLTPRYIWYEEERACVPADQCGSQPPFHPLSGKTYIYDLQDRTETESVITSVADVWPHAA